jgi:hypothetical protein
MSNIKFLSGLVKKQNNIDTYSKIGLVLAIAAALLAGMIGIAGAQTPPPGYGGTPIVSSVTFPVSNVLDVGYMPSSSSPWQFWALDSYTETLTIWQSDSSATTGTYAVNTVDTGTWCTFAGALSPYYGVPEPSNGCGALSSDDSGILTTDAPFNSALTTTPVTGTLGALNCGGTEAMIVVGGVQVSNPTVPGGGPCDTSLQYFFPSIQQDAVSNLWNTESYSGTYTYGAAPSISTDTEETSTNQGSTGDIITSAPITSGSPTTGVVTATYTSTYAPATCVLGVSDSGEPGLEATAVDLSSGSGKLWVENAGNSDSNGVPSVMSVNLAFNDVGQGAAADGGWVDGTWAANSGWVPGMSTMWTAPTNAYGGVDGSYPLYGVTRNPEGPAYGSLTSGSGGSGYQEIDFSVTAPSSLPAGTYTQQIVLTSSC